MVSEKHVFILQPFSTTFDSAFFMIRDAATRVGARTSRLDQIAVPGSVTEQLYQAIDDCDIVVCDITGADPNVMYELGYAHGIRKPVILVSGNPTETPFDVRSVRLLVYDDRTDSPGFVRGLETMIRDGLADPKPFKTRPRTEASVNTVFVSYSHQDTDFLDRLRVHLKPLEKQGLVDLWDDSRIDAGDQWKAAIEEALTRARVAVLLVSADFLASDFIVDDELPPLLAKAEADGTRIMPVVVKPCRFLRDTSLNRFQAINDPASPLVSMSVGDQESVFDQVSQLIERLMVSAGPVA